MVDIGTNPTGSPTYPLDVVAALSSDRKTFVLSIVNPTQEAQELSARVAGATLGQEGKLWQIAAPSANAVNEPGKKLAVQILEYEQKTLPGTVQIPAVSVSVYQFNVSPSSIRKFTTMT